MRPATHQSSALHSSGLVIVMIDSYRHSFYPRARQTVEQKNLSYRIEFSCPTKVFNLTISLYSLLVEHLFLHTGLGYLRFYPGIENLILPMLSYPGYHVRVSNIGCIGTHAHGRHVTSLLCKCDVIM